jgi:hypothetical protein
MKYIRLIFRFFERMEGGRERTPNYFTTHDYLWSTVFNVVYPFSLAMTKALFWQASEMENSVNLSHNWPR